MKPQRRKQHSGSKQDYQTQKFSKRKTRKNARRAKQQEDIRRKSEQHIRFYLSEFHKNRALRNVICSNNLRQNSAAEKQIFLKQRKAGINFKDYSNLKVEKSGPFVDDIAGIETFSDIDKDIPSFLSRNLRMMNYENPTPIQCHGIPLGLRRKDIMCCAQTGSGKTCVFALCVIAHLSTSMNMDKGRKREEMFSGTACAPKAIILSPTRELALQIDAEYRKLCNCSRIECATVYGGSSTTNQLSRLAQGADIVTATPGRLQDFVNKDVISMQNVECLILDEADQMLDMGFIPQVRKLVLNSGMPSPINRHTMMFSATFPTEIQRLAADFLNDYTWIAIGRIGSTVKAITQKLIQTPNDNRVKLKILEDILDDVMEQDGHAIVFTQMKRTADWVWRKITRSHDRSFAAVIHGDRSQSEREKALGLFRRKKTRVLVATNVAARGLDIDDVSHVINFDLGANKDEFDSYVHRIGRTGRKGNKGIAISFYIPGYDPPKKASGKIAPLLLKLLREAKQEIPDWFMNLPEVNSTSYEGTKHRQKFGGHDYRAGKGGQYKSHIHEHKTKRDYDSKRSHSKAKRKVIVTKPNVGWEYDPNARTYNDSLDYSGWDDTHTNANNDLSAQFERLKLEHSEAGRSQLNHNGNNQQLTKNRKNRKDARDSASRNTLSSPYVSRQLGKKEEISYKAAGILPFKIDPKTGKIWILGGVEKRKERSNKKKKKVLGFNLLGGKREPDDASAAHTAWREFWEESGEVLNEKDCNRFFSQVHNRSSIANSVQNNFSVAWIPNAKYCLYVYDCTGDINITNLPDMYSKLSELPEHAEMQRLMWIELASYLESTSSRKKQIVSNTVAGNGNINGYPISSFAKLTMRTEELRKYLEALPRNVKSARNSAKPNSHQSKKGDVSKKSRSKKKKIGKNMKGQKNRNVTKMTTNNNKLRDPQSNKKNAGTKKANIQKSATTVGTKWTPNN